MDTFSLWTPIVKADVEPVHGEQTRIVRGIGSTEVWDQQREKILQDGIDLSWLVTKGYINWNHQPGPANIIGEPLSAEVVSGDRLTTLLNELHSPAKPTGPALYTVGALYDNPRGNEVWELIQGIEKAQQAGYSRRQVGWSVEGLALQKNGPVISRFLCRNLAITHEPVNQETWARIAKSWSDIWAQDTSYDVSQGNHYAFDDLDSLAKSLTLSHAEPVRLQNLAGYDNIDLRTIECALLGVCKADSPCHDGEGNFHQGKPGFMKHLAECHGYSPKEARLLLTKLSKALQ